MRAENGGGVISHTTEVKYLYNTYTENSVESVKSVTLDNSPPFQTVLYIMKLEHLPR